MLTRKGARRLTSMLDQVATVVQENPKILGVDSRIAADFAYRCDLLSDAVETRAVNNFPRQASEHDDEEEAEDEEVPESKKKASVNARLARLRRLAAEADAEEEAEDEEAPESKKKASFARRAGFDAATIGEEVPGPLEMLDSDEPWMDDHFTQERFEELRGAHQSGALGAKPYFAPNAKKAALEGLHILAAGPSRGFSDKSKMPSIELDDTTGQLAGLVKQLTELQQAVAQREAKLKAIAAQELQELEESKDAAAKALKVLTEAMRPALKEHGNYVLKARDGLLEVTAMYQAVAKSRTLDAVYAQTLIDVANKYGDEVAQFISQTVDSLREMDKPLTISYKGSEMLMKSASYRSAGLIDSIVQFKDYIVKSVSKLVSIFTTATNLLKNKFKKVESSRSEVLNALKQGKKASHTWLTEK